MDNENVIKELKISPPSYLMELGIQDKEIILVHLEEDLSKEKNLSLSRTESTTQSTIDENLDVTGSPLEVDLKGDISFASCGKIKTFAWTEEEARYFPLQIIKARGYINQRNRRKQSQEIGNDKLPVFVVCDGDNSTNTIIIAAQRGCKDITTCKIDILGYLSPEDDLISLGNMEKHHRTTLGQRGKESKVTFLTKYKYYLYGNYIQNIKHIFELEHFGSICLEIKCNSKCSLYSPQNALNDKNMVLQIIAGHSLSPVHFLWKDLCLLQSYLDILSSVEKHNNSETVIARNFIEICDIYKSIDNVIRSPLTRQITKDQFDLDNLRVENILDKLWIIFRDCENLFALQDCFHYLFEALITAEVNIKIPEKNLSNIATIISGILNGKLAVPTLTLSQALEFLFELGAEKLKNDYQAIIKNFCATSEGMISEKWSQLQNKLKLQDGLRKTRVTVNFKAKTDVTHNISKLAYLGNLHVGVEFIYLVERNSFLTEETFDYFCDKIYKSFVKESTLGSFWDLQNSPRCEFALVLDITDMEIKKDKPALWSLQMTSSCPNSFEVVTLYHLSQYQIFPPTIYDDYNMDEVIRRSESQEYYYACRLNKIKELV